MSRIQELGPFVSKLNKYADIDVDGYNDPNTIGFSVPDTADSFLQEVGAINLEIGSNGGDIQIEWTLELTIRDGGVEIWGLTINRVWGTLKFDIIVPDPLDDDDYEEFEHEMEFSTVGKLVNNELVPSGWTMEARYDKLSLAEGIWPMGMEIDVDSKNIKVNFE
jgi:hypothetical protein